MARMLAWLLLGMSACGSRTALEGGAGGGGAASTTSGQTVTTTGAGGSCNYAPFSTAFGSAEDLEDGSGITVDRLGCAVLATGELRAPATIEGQPFAGGIFLTKWNGLGEHQWTHRFGDADGNLAVAVGTDPEHRVVLGGHAWDPIDLGGGMLPAAGKWDVVVASYDADGTHRWSKRFGDGDYQHLTGLGVDFFGNVVLVGELAGSIDFGGGPLVPQGLWDVFIAKLDADGRHVFSTRYGDEGAELSPHVALAPNGRVFVTGYETRGGGENVYVLRLSDDGRVDGGERFGGQGDQRPGGLVIRPHGGYAVVGEFTDRIQREEQINLAVGERDAFVWATDGQGGGWLRTFGSTERDSAEGVAVTPDGRVWVTGITTGPIDFGTGVLVPAGAADLYLLELAADGRTLSARLFGDAATQRTPRLATTEDAVALTGAFEGTIQLGETVHESAGGTDAFVALLSIR